MKRIIIENLKPGNLILAFYSVELNWLGIQKMPFHEKSEWIKCKIIRIEKYLITMEGIEGGFKGFKWTENLKALKDPDSPPRAEILSFVTPIFCYLNAHKRLSCSPKW